jgi:AcrR family transcriptional regulator
MKLPMETNDTAAYEPPSRIRNPELLKQGRTKITESAMELFSKKGFHDTGVEEIAEGAGLTVGALYKYVRSKHDILFLTSHYMTEALVERFQPLMESDLDPEEKLRAAIDSYCRTMNDFARAIRMNYRTAANLDREARRTLFTLFGTLREGFLKLLIPVADKYGGMEPTTLRVLADNLVLVAQMWAVNNRAYAEHVNLDEFIEIQTYLTFRQLGANPRPVIGDSAK